jgi:hypothetical protein
MRVLKRVLYVQALLAALAGLALAAVPRFVLVTVFAQLPYTEYAWVRIVGLQALAGAMFAVLVAQRVEDLWWWGWAFAIPTALAFLVFGLNAAFGLRCERGACPSTILWWTLTGVTALLTAGFVVGLARAGQEAPPL